MGRHAFLVAAGIFLSRIAGLVRERVFAHYFGISFAADAFAALRIPNILQNLFGEGVLSASFIPVYAKLVAQKERRSGPGGGRSVLPSGDGDLRAGAGWRAGHALDH